MSPASRIISHDALPDEMIASGRGEHPAPPDTGKPSFESEKAMSPHPGSFIRTEIIQGRSLTVSQAAEALRVLRPTLSAVLNGRASLSPEMALRLEKAFGLSMNTLMRMQCEYDIAQTRQREAEIDVPPFEGSIKPGSQGSLL